MTARRVKPTRAPSRLMPAMLGIAIAALGFATLMIRLEVIREGYRIAALSEEIARLQDQNRTLRLDQAQLSSHARLRSLAPQFQLAPPTPRQVVMMP
jgi:cell division protein FtsL